MSGSIGRVITRGKASVDVERENFEKTQVIDFVYKLVTDDSLRGVGVADNYLPLHQQLDSFSLILSVERLMMLMHFVWRLQIVSSDTPGWWCRRIHAKRASPICGQLCINETHSSLVK